MNGKGSKPRPMNYEKWAEGWNRIFKPKEPFYSDIQVYESKFRKSKPLVPLHSKHNS